MTDTTGAHTYTYDSANRLTSADGVTYTWDDRGNLTHDGTFTYTYNAAGRLVRAEGVTSTLVYTYNAAGLRVAQSVNGDETEFSWDWASGLPEMLNEGDNLYLVGYDTLGTWDGATWAYHLPDALGSVRQATDATGAVTAAREWTPYGVEVSGAQAGLGYTGEWFDGGVGLEYLRARWYAPYLNRFISPDTIVPDFQNPQSINPYVYVLGNPIGYVDPSGHKSVDDSRAQMLHDYGTTLLDDDLTPMDRFIAFMEYAAPLYYNLLTGEYDTDQYMLDVSAVLQGYEHNTLANGHYFFSGRLASRGIGRSGYFLDQAFYREEDLVEHDGWNDQYRDGSKHQVHHFWYYVAVSYFDAPDLAHFGAWIHEQTIPALDQYGSQEDLNLGIKGVELGIRLAYYDHPGYFKWYCGPYRFAIKGGALSLKEVPSWLMINLKEHSAWDGPPVM